MKYILKIFFFIFFANIFFFKAFGNERYICSRDNISEILNFFISDDKLYLSGLSISGTYSILDKYDRGVLAINMSKIGTNSGIEIVYLDFIKKTFSIKSKLSTKIKNNLIKIQGNCDKVK